MTIEHFLRTLILAGSLIAAPAWSQALDPIKVEAMVAERMAARERAEVRLNGRPAVVLKGALGEIDDTEVIVIVLENDSFLLFEIEDIFSDPPSPTVGAHFIVADNARYYGTLALTVTEQEDYLFDGTLASEGGETLAVSGLLNEALVGDGDAEVWREDSRLVISGTLGYSTYSKLRKALADNPDVTMLELRDVPGSGDDEINVQTGRLIRQAGLTTFVSAGSYAASGGVDLFAAGVERKVEKGAILGIHSWCCSDDGTPVAELPRDHPAHAEQLAYFTEMLGKEAGTEFYFLTLNAAPAEDIHEMTVAEMTSTGLVTEFRQ